MSLNAEFLAGGSLGPQKSATAPRESGAPSPPPPAHPPSSKTHPKHTKNHTTVDPDPGYLANGTGPLYASNAQVFAALDRWAAANPRYLSVYRVADPQAASGSGSLTVARFTDRDAPSAPPKRRVLISCSLHAREMIATEVCLNLLRLLAGTPTDRTPALSWAETKTSLTRANIVKPRPSLTTGLPRDPVALFAAALAAKFDLHVVPIVNADGRRLIETQGRYSQRKTVDGVDLNRNFPFAWRRSTDTRAETYPGPSPASQWETRALMSLFESVKPDAHADIHSGIAAFLTPMGTTCQHSQIAAKDVAPLQAAADASVKALGQAYTLGPSAAVLYIAYGTCSDHTYATLNVPAVTVEVFGGSSSGLGVTCPKLQQWKDRCTKPEGNSGPSRGCTAECGSDLRCKRAVRPRNGSGRSSSGSSSSSSSRAQVAAAARRTGAPPALAKWQAQLAEATAEDPALLVPDGELLWFEWERDRARQREMEKNGTMTVATASVVGETTPSGLLNAAVDAALDASSSRRAQREALWRDLERVVGGGGGENGGVSVSATPSAVAPLAASPSWYAKDPYLRHYSRVSSSERSMFTYFNPITVQQYRKVVSDFTAALLAFTWSATGQPAVGPF